jgi:hypothetical protein
LSWFEFEMMGEEISNSVALSSLTVTQDSACDNHVIPVVYEKQMKKIVFTHRIVKLDNIDLLNNSFDMQIQIFVRWKDTSLPNLGKKERISDSSWQPYYKFTDAINIKEHDKIIRMADNNHTVEKKSVFTGKFKANFCLKNFPFDRQVLTAIVAVQDVHKCGIKHVAKGMMTSKLVGAELQQWRVVGVTSEVQYRRLGEADYKPVYIISVNLCRFSLYWLLNVWVPLIVTLALALTAFLYPVDALYSRMNVVVGVLFSIFAYRFNLDLPHVRYMTGFDYFFVGNVIWISFIAFVSVIVHSVVKDRRHAMRVNTVCGQFALVLFLMCNVGFLVIASLAYEGHCAHPMRRIMRRASALPQKENDGDEAMDIQKNASLYFDQQNPLYEGTPAAGAGKRESRRKSGRSEF